ncbi:MAG: saccharopine dehydrogenase-like oxidoreductase [Cyanobacteria bacterium J06639_1]
MQLAIFGAGGLGRSMVALAHYKQNLRTVALLDSSGYVFDAEGIPPLDDSFAGCALMPGAVLSDRAIDRVIHERADEIDAIFLALPNLPNHFIPSVIDRVMAAGFRGVMADALKRTSAMEMVLARSEALRHAGITYITGAGATPGLLTAAAMVAAQSFVDVRAVDIEFGVGIANWEQYRATIREDIAHMAGFDVPTAQALSDEEVEALLDTTDGLLHLVEMEHADDIMLELAGVCARDRVTVGGVVDTRCPKKPLSTTVTVRGITFEGKESAHTFTLGDETSMAANVNGPVLGYLQTAAWLHQQNIYGCLTAAQVMPQYSPMRPELRTQLTQHQVARVPATH